jgi:hypothetical protein
VSLDERLQTFWKIVVPPLLSASSLRRMLALKVQAPWSFETLGTTHPTTQHHIREDLKRLHREDIIQDDQHWWKHQWMMLIITSVFLHRNLMMNLISYMEK